MSDRTGGEAFPWVHPSDCVAGGSGMTLRDYFAGQALTRLSQDRLFFVGEDETQKALVRRAEQLYQLADAMIAERGKDG